MAVASWRPSATVETLIERAAMLAEVRAFFAERGVLEVQTPLVAPSTVADPAIESFRVDPVEVDNGPRRKSRREPRFLQTSPEHHMKRLLAAGAPSIYQLGPAFRAGESGRWHNPEFTMLEWYRLGFDETQLMDEVAALVDALLGTAPYRRRSHAALLDERFGLRPEPAAHDLVAAAQGEGFAVDPKAPRAAAEAADFLIAEAIAGLGAERVFVTDFPASEAALARLHADGTAARFELIVDGQEVANGYHELLDAEELATRLAADARTRRQSGLAPVAAGGALVAAQRHGLPDCAGVAVGFDRLVALKLGLPRLADAMAFGWKSA